MRFNPIIWHVLVYAYYLEHPDAREALEAYAAVCDGKVDYPNRNGLPKAEFVPNPIPHY